MARTRAPRRTAQTYNRSPAFVPVWQSTPPPYFKSLDRCLTPSPGVVITNPAATGVFPDETRFTPYVFAANRNF